MGGTVTGQYMRTQEWMCSHCGEQRECVMEWDYCPAGSDVPRWAFCKSCLEGFLKRFKK